MNISILTSDKLYNDLNSKDTKIGWYFLWFLHCCKKIHYNMEIQSLVENHESWPIRLKSDGEYYNLSLPVLLSRGRCGSRVSWGFQYCTKIRWVISQIVLLFTKKLSASCADYCQVDD